MKFTFDGKVFVSTTITNDEQPQSPSPSLSPSLLSNSASDSDSDSDSVSNDHYDASLLNTNTVAVASATTAASKTSRNTKTNANGNNNGNGNVNGQTNNNNSNSSINRVLVSVRDTGIGINTQIKDQLFEKFATKSRQGTGLGLYLSKKIIESHGGNIWYEVLAKENGRDVNKDAYDNGDSIKTGTIFRFSIPITISKKKSIENEKY
ncbi:MAG: HAMP domain-containing sensor histidine kinase [Candidatus Nitrosocosmicus sp.]